jgi:hypothetical protein
MSAKNDWAARAGAARSGKKYLLIIRTMDGCATYNDRERVSCQEIVLQKSV